MVRIEFFADETWKCMQMLILSHIVVIQVHAIEEEMKIKPSAMTTDPCENHFGNTRQNCGGSRTGLAVMGWQAGDNKSTLAKASNFSAVGNNREAEITYDSNQMHPRRLEKY